MSKVNRYQALIIILLVTSIIISGIVAWSRYSSGRPMEISIVTPLAHEQSNLIYVGGAVNNPGFYGLEAADSINDIIKAAGGTTSDADLNQLELYVTEIGEEQPQKININRAESWLLEALPGIGKTRAQAIIDFRQRNGPFRNINELAKVENIGTATCEQIKHLITVAD